MRDGEKMRVMLTDVSSTEKMAVMTEMENMVMCGKCKENNKDHCDSLSHSTSAVLYWILFQLLACRTKQKNVLVLLFHWVTSINTRMLS